tara:strand:- start:237 stop:461 length:225 start_codon:yes stop_codon:yes gene_type:complete
MGFFKKREDINFIGVIGNLIAIVGNVWVIVTVFQSWNLPIFNILLNVMIPLFVVALGKVISGTQKDDDISLTEE